MLKVGAVEPEQNAGIAAKLGTDNELTTTLIVVVGAHKAVNV